MQQNIHRDFAVFFIGVLLTFAAAEETQQFMVTKMNQTQYGTILGTYSFRSTLECTKECAKSEQCRSAIFEASLKTCTTNRWALRNESASECNSATCEPPSEIEYAEKQFKTTMRLPCLEHSDCVDPMSECRHDECLCMPGYSYDKNSYRCVSECAVYGTTFQPNLGKFIYLNNQGYSFVFTAEKCISACISKTSFVCKAIDQCADGCYMSTITTFDRPDLRHDSNNCVLYTRDCE